MRAMVCATEGISEATTDAQEIATVLEKTKDRMMATGFIMGADESRYRTMILEFENSYTMGVNKWPSTLTSAHRVLANWKGPAAAGVRTETHGVSFNTDGGETEGRGPRCWYCNEQRVGTPEERLHQTTRWRVGRRPDKSGDRRRGRQHAGQRVNRRRWRHRADGRPAAHKRRQQRGI